MDTYETKLLVVHDMALTCVAESNQQKRKRGVKHQEDYKVNVVKKARVKGTDYINHANKSVPKRKTGEECRLVTPAVEACTFRVNFHR